MTPTPDTSPLMLPALDATRAREIANRFSTAHVIVIGDVMLDRFIVGRVDRISPEAPVPIVLFDREEHRPGGAANVAVNARALGAQVTLIGVVGEDSAADDLRAGLAARDVATSSLLTEPKRRTTTKVRIVTTRNQQVARLDYENDGDVGEALEASLLSQLKAHASAKSTLIVSDYLKGTITRRLMKEVVDLGVLSGFAVLVDPKIPHIDYYAGARLVTPNHHEAELATNTRIKDHRDARGAAVAFGTRAQCDGVLITRGEHGMWLTHGSAEGYLPASAREVSDVTGAGDTVIATLGVALSSGATVTEAARLANEAAGIVVGKFGPASVTREELLARF
jgi:rfaE bifunctional protein kinase chain/domain